MMKRKDSELSYEATCEILESNKYAVVSLIDAEGMPYGVALDYIYKDDCLYFHGAKEGRKTDAMAKNPRACAVILGETKVIPNRFGREYVSAVAEGPITLIDDPEVKRTVMRWVVERNSPDYIEKGYAVVEKLLERVLIYKMEIKSLTGKHGL